MDATRFYRHSGKVTPQGLLFGAAAGGVGGPVLGVLYALATYFIPLIYVNFLLTLGFGVAIGFSVGFAMRIGHVRNTAVTMVAAFGAAVLSHYVGWMTWVAAVLSDAPGATPLAVLNPLYLFESVSAISDVGAWTLKGQAVNGAMLWVIWFVELAMVFGATLFGAFGAATSTPYCERCGSWCEERPDHGRLALPASDDELARRVEAHDLGALAELPNAEGHAAEWIELEVEACARCGVTNALTVSHVKMSKDSKGNDKRESDDLLHRLLVSPEEAAWVEGLARRAPPVAEGFSAAPAP